MAVTSRMPGARTAGERVPDEECQESDGRERPETAAPCEVYGEGSAKHRHEKGEREPPGRVGDTPMRFDPIKKFRQGSRQIEQPGGNPGGRPPTGGNRRQAHGDQDGHGQQDREVRQQAGERETVKVQGHGQREAELHDSGGHHRAPHGQDENGRTA